jgi:signal transduction histidine kinase
LRADLHDGLGPTLASVALGLDAAGAHVDDAQLRGLLADLTTDVREAIDDIRRLVYGLRPPALDDYGLVRSVEQYASSLATRAGGAFEVTVSVGDLPPLPAAVEVAAYRITTEAMTNVTRHAKAGRCDVSLSVRGDDLWVEVADDGQGIGASNPGVGMTSMRERAEELRGQFTISRRERGTTVAARLPLGTAVAT